MGSCGRRMGAMGVPWNAVGAPWAAPWAPICAAWASTGPKTFGIVCSACTEPLLLLSAFAIVRSACAKRLLLLKTSVSCTRNPYFLGCSICTVCTRVLKGRALNSCACAQKQRAHFGGITQNTLAAIGSNNWPKPRPPDLPFHTRRKPGWRELHNLLQINCYMIFYWCW